MPYQQRLSTPRIEQNLAYLDDYLDTLESLTAEVQRNFTFMQLLDDNAKKEDDEVANQITQLADNLYELNPEERIERLKKLNISLSAGGRCTEERMSLTTLTYDIVERHVRRLDDNLQKFEDDRRKGHGRISAGTASHASRDETSARKHYHKTDKERKDPKDRKVHHNGESSNAKKRKVKHDVGLHSTSHPRHHNDKERDKPTKVSRKKENGKSGKVNATEKMTMGEDPNEPIYCYCKQVSYGEMVACDNNECSIEWFHFACVGITDHPKGKWFCKECKNRHKK